MIFSMAWKNMLRYKRRSLITAAAIAIGILFSIYIDGLLVGLDRESSENMIRYETSGAKIFASGYFSERKTYPIDFLITGTQRMAFEKWITEFISSLIYTPRYSVACELIFSNSDGFSGSLTGLLYGIDPLSDKKVFDTYRCVEQGTWFATDRRTESDDFSKSNSSEGVVLGSGIAHDLGVSINDYITVLTDSFLK